MLNADPQELAKFSDLAHRWWDPESEFRPLHQINPLRLEWINALAPVAGQQVLDVGCGGGILAEAMARKGAAQVTGSDLAVKPLRVAQLHALEAGVQNVQYREVAAEALAAQQPAAFDVVTCMEMLEHIPDPAATVHTLAQLVSPGGSLIVSTLNRNFRSFMLAIVGAEYLTRLVPRGTHEYERLIKPSQLASWARSAGLELAELRGIEYDPIGRSARLTADIAVNYLAHLRKPPERA